MLVKPGCGKESAIAIMSAGAYGMSMSSNYNTRPRAAEVMVDGDRVHEGQTLVRLDATVTRANLAVVVSTAGFVVAACGPAVARVEPGLRGLQFPRAQPQLREGMERTGRLQFEDARAAAR